MSFFGGPPQQVKKPFAEVLPDQRKRLTRYFLVTTTGQVPPELDFVPGTVDSWPQDQTPSGWTGLYLTYKKFEDSENAPGKDTRPILQLIYEQIALTGETQVGDPGVTYDQDGNLNVEIDWVQFSSTTATPQTVGVTICQSPYTSAILKEEIDTDDGTLRRIKRIYNGDRTLSDIQELRFGGKLIIRTITAIGTIPPTPSGYTLVGPGVLHPDGRQVYTYQFAAVNGGGGGGTPGTSAEIGRSYTNSQGGEVAFNPATPNAATGEVICTIRYVTATSVTTDPTTGPTDFVRFAVDVEDDTGFRMWTVKYGFGGGNSISVDVNGQADGALIYSVQQNDDNGNLVPAYPGTGTAYNVKTTHTRDNGFWRNLSIWHKPPADDTYKKTIEFEEPGIAEFTGSPPQFVLHPPKQRTLLADVEVSYATTQTTTTPFSIDAYAAFYETYTPTDTGIAVQSQRGLGGYLAQASGTSGTSTDYNGVPCDSFEAHLLSSIPSTFPTGATTLKVDNDPYLTDISGVKVYRRSVVSYSF